MRKNGRECGELSPGPLGSKRECLPFLLRPIPLLGAWVSASFFLQSPAQTFDDIGLNNFELKEIETKELNALLKKKKIDDNRQKEIKQRRRTLNNRWNTCLLLASTDIWKE